MQRWPKAIPQYVTAMRIGWRRSIARSPTSVAWCLTGAAYRGSAWPVAAIRRPQLPTASREGEPHAVVHGRAGPGVSVSH